MSSLKSGERTYRLVKFEDLWMYFEEIKHLFIELYKTFILALYLSTMNAELHFKLPNKQN